MEQENRESSESSLLIGIGIGMVCFALLIQVGLFVLSEDLLYQSIGLWIGVAIGFGMFCHMKRSVEDALDIDPSNAVKHMRNKSVLRLGAVLVAFSVVAYFQIGSILTAFIGAMGLKISVYLQPYIDKVRKNLRKGG